MNLALPKRPWYVPAAHLATDTMKQAEESVGAAIPTIADVSRGMLGALRDRVRDRRREGVMLAATVRGEVLAFLEAHGEGATADEIAEAIGRSYFTVRPRCTELNRAGIIKDSLSRRPNRSGKNAIVWVMV
jgi:DNA-binding transcriptional ArsR family regulator